MANKKTMTDRMLEVAPIGEERGEIAVTGRLSIGKEGNPVTITIIDEVTGETLEINNVNRAFMVIEDTRRSSNGWLSLALGELDKLAEVLSFLAKTTLSGLKKMAKR
jgi:hypothetical protein